MLAFPNAKINLGLYIVEKRPDGFHNLETIFFPIPWKDILEVVPAKGAVSTLHTTGISIDAPAEKNLAFKAYHLLADRYHLPPVDIYLHKVVPFGAGLGGGSSDAAHMLLLLNSLYSLNIATDTLKEYAAILGSDCPFFIDNTPSLATGRGEILSPADVNLTGYRIVLVKPSFGISTPEAFAGIKPQTPEVKLVDALKKPISTWRDSIKNDFEHHLFVKYPLLEEIKNALYDAGAAYASMSGSGSTMYGIFDKDISFNFDGCTIFTATL